jgi:short-subunit dehydrogenase
MKINLKDINEQVIVITGASSGIGLATARMAARQGAKVVLAGRSEEALRQVVDEIRSTGGEAIHVVADVGVEEDVRRIAAETIQHFGGFDTWVNNAGVSIYGQLADVPVHDERKLFETNYWGVVYGSRIALEHLRARGGALINIGSVLSDRAFPLQGAYSASKAAVKAYTDTLRMELEQQGCPVAVTLIQPTAIATPFPEHARNYMDAQPRLMAPVYAPHLVAESILHAAQVPTRDLMVGGAAKALSTMAKYAPRVTDKFLEKTAFENQKREVAVGGRKDTLMTPSEDPRERGQHDGAVLESSLYTTSARNPGTTAAIAVGAGMAIAAIVIGQRRRSRVQNGL